MQHSLCLGEELCVSSYTIWAITFLPCSVGCDFPYKVSALCILLIIGSQGADTFVLLPAIVNFNLWKHHEVVYGTNKRDLALSWWLKNWQLGIWKHALAWKCTCYSKCAHLPFKIYLIPFDYHADYYEVCQIRIKNKHSCTLEMCMH